MIHVVAVPAFMIGVCAVALELISGRFLFALLWALLPVASLAAQGIGHKRERVPPAPFRGALDFFRRIFLEQFFRFWRFAFSGEWLHNLRAARLGSGP
jgi:hypothetical protein